MAFSRQEIKSGLRDDECSRRSRSRRSAAGSTCWAPIACGLRKPRKWTVAEELALLLDNWACDAGCARLPPSFLANKTDAAKRNQRAVVKLRVGDETWRLGQKRLSDGERRAFGAELTTLYNEQMNSNWGSEGVAQAEVRARYCPRCTHATAFGEALGHGSGCRRHDGASR